MTLDSRGGKEEVSSIQNIGGGKTDDKRQVNSRLTSLAKDFLLFIDKNSKKIHDFRKR